MTFDSWEDVLAKVTIYQDENCQLLTTLRGEQLYPSDLKRDHLNSKQIEEVINKLKYRYNILKCKLGAPSSKPKKEKTRKTSTFNHDCPFFIRFEKIRDERNDYKLIITNINTIHENHPLQFKKLYKTLPEKRRLPPEVKSEAAEWIRMGCSNKRIRCEIAEKHKIHVKSKDISNLRQSLRPANSNNLKTFDKLLRNKYGKIFFITPGLKVRF
ncbi:uncharacterized protein LOC141534970 isoform X1 [Cotesia typhae]|uniref:uncharacterized protein LOC141534970 isoform X1 n=1 Tax=Cotesia typhae TaxID=2053667 RepID=UPI003D68578C